MKIAFKFLSILISWLVACGSRNDETTGGNLTSSSSKKIADPRTVAEEIQIYGVSRCIAATLVQSAGLVKSPNVEADGPEIRSNNAVMKFFGDGRRHLINSMNNPSIETAIDNMVKEQGKYFSNIVRISGWDYFIPEYRKCADLLYVSASAPISSPIDSCTKEIDRRFCEIPKTEEISVTGFKNESEAQFMKTHGFDKMEDFIKYQKSSIEEKVTISANNFAKKHTAIYVIDCAIKIVLYKDRHLVAFGEATEKNIKNADYFVGTYWTVLEEMKKTGRVEAKAVTEKLKERVEILSQFYNDSEDNKLIILKELNNCRVIMPYFSEKVLSEYKYDTSSSSIHPESFTIQRKSDLGRTQNSAALESNSGPFTTSFDCSKASTTVEKMICSDRDLAGMDIDLSDIYRRAMNISSDKQGLRKQQIEWLKRRNSCVSKQCLIEQMESRIEELHNP